MTTPNEQAGLWRSGLHTLATSVSSVAIGLGTSVLIARSLGPEAKGEYDVVLATGALLSLTLGLSLPVGTTYTVARGLAVPGVLVRRLAWWGLFQGLATLVLAVAVLSLPWGGALVPPTIGLAGVPFLAALVTLTSVGAYLRAVLLGEQRFIDANIGDLLGRFAAPVAMVLAVLVTVSSGGRPTAVLLLSCGLVGLVLTLAYYVRALGRQLDVREGPSGLRAVIGFSLPTHAGNVVQFFNYRLDLFLVSAFLGIRAVGLYALAVSLAQLIWLVSNAAAVVLLPRVASQATSLAESASRSAQVARLSFALSVAGATALGVTGALIVPLVYGEAFRGAIPPLLWLLPGVAGFSFVNVLAAHIGGVGKPRVNFAVSVVGFGVTILLDLLLIPALGIAGAAMASSASYLTSALLTIVIFVRMTGVSALHVVFPRASDVALVRQAAGRLSRSRRSD